MNNPYDSAFPLPAGPLLTEDGFTNPIHREEYGLTIRELFAAMAMQGFVQQCAFHKQTANNEAAWVAEQSLIVADALIAELNKEPSK